MAMPIIPWIGGKRRLADVLIPRFPPHTCYVEVFAGAAALFFMRPPAEVEVVNDVSDDLVNLYRVVQHHPEEFVRQFKWALSSRQVFKWLSDTPPEILTDIQRAARFYYLQQNCFGGRVEGRTFGTATTSPPGLNLMRIEETLSAAHLRLSGTYIEKLDWQACVKRYDRPHTFFYLDPPYLETEGYGVPFEFEQYEKMAQVLRTLQGRAILTLNDHPEIQALFAGFQMERVEIPYMVGGAANTVLRGELIIYSWDRAKDPVGLF
ncbi:restriction endonuclease subunit M [Burkholderia sp. WAC0059]|uniref:DNA adenine methylase n=1 Tax=Burkholderia sp. WAC0059 TaxID=2066022 RepID=UPI000C7F3267|nr:DNA adenine methylase [Burkholderia sp. WAC0059]PLZ01875.1 restriction endonuclease subunit M [Burkholderia sp. WAC0059]